MPKHATIRQQLQELTEEIKALRALVETLQQPSTAEQIEVSTGDNQQVSRHSRLEIDDFDRVRFSTKTITCLHSVGIQTLGELIGLSKEEVLGIPNLGQVRLTEIVQTLDRFGLTLTCRYGPPIERGREYLAYDEGEDDLLGI